MEYTLHTDSAIHNICCHLKLENVIAVRTDKSNDLWYKKWSIILGTLPSKLKVCYHGQRFIKFVLKMV